MKRLYTDLEASEDLAISKSKLWALVRGKQLPVVQVGQRSKRFDIQDLDKYIKSGKRKG